MSKTIAEWMEESGVTFGTSGARGLVTQMTDKVCYAYTLGFLQYLKEMKKITLDVRMAIAGDRRPSTPRIMSAVGKAAVDFGIVPVNCGLIPSPAVALIGLQEKIPAVMVTGSHIPADRNGIKYNTPIGEVLKEDEAGMMAQVVTVPDIFDENGMFKSSYTLPGESSNAYNAYINRWRDAFPEKMLAGRKIGIYQHSCVGRDLLVRVYQTLGAEVTLLGRSSDFIPVDTEAIRPEDTALAKKWASEYSFDAIISTDGDSDRPLISDQDGNWLRGDVAGILTAKYLGADVVCTPVSCNTALEKSGIAPTVKRTRIGSPYVIAAMNEALAAGASRVVGYEANGGFLTGSPIQIPGGGTLPPLPTRDPIIVQLAILALALQEGTSISALVAALPERVTFSDRVKGLPIQASAPKITALADGGPPTIESTFTAFGQVKETDTTDGLRITFMNDEVVHLRPSGNAPELRCYTEADSQARAEQINAMAMEVLKGWA